MNTPNKTLRNTPQRQLVLETVRSNTNHPTADEIYDLARERDPLISKGTVYRNLNLLYSLNEIQKLSMPYGPDHYDFNLAKHYHFICRSCCKVVDAELSYEDSFNNVEADLPGYKTEWHRLVFVGLCPECIKKIEEEN
ncbi:MAG: transcriptional repressor [Oscillospiraceae bacterium]